ncbi:MAG: hypothetical protein GY804_14440 [Alphaproteobacteria bacterium]|nr:hypothetical protein [Alphaproteobacteria bacterium]
MSIAVQRRRGASADHATFTGFDGEVTVDTDKKTLVVHDGATAGGFSLAREDFSNVSSANFNNLGFAKDDLSNVSEDNPITSGLAKTDLSNVTQDTIAGKGVAKTDLSNVDPAAVEIALAYSAKGFFDGFITSNSAGDSDHDIEIQAGVCRDADDTCFMKSNSAITKQIDADWAVGNNAGGLPANVPLAIHTTYGVFVISNPTTGEVDAGFDTSPTAVNLLAAAAGLGFTKYRRIDLRRTDANANIIGFSTIDGCNFEWDAPQMDFSAAPFNVAAEALVSLTVPTGIQVKPKIIASVNRSASTTCIYRIRSPQATDPIYVLRSCDDTVAQMASFSNFTTDTEGRLYQSTYNANAASAGIDTVGYFYDRRTL